MVNYIDSRNEEEMLFEADRKFQSMHNTWSSKQKWANIHNEVWAKENSETSQIPSTPHTQSMLITLIFSEYRTLRNTQYFYTDVCDHLRQFSGIFRCVAL